MGIRNFLNGLISANEMYYSQITLPQDSMIAKGRMNRKPD